MQSDILQELKEENTRLRAEVAALKELVEALKQLLKLNSRNSSKPPSLGSEAQQTYWSESRRSKGWTPGKSATAAAGRSN